MTGPRHSDWYGDDGSDAPPPEPKVGEPVAIAQLVTVLLGAAVTAGWIQLDDSLLQLAITAIGLVGAVVATIIARSKVSPTNGGIWAIVREVVEEVIADRVAAEMERQRLARRRPPPDPRMQQPDPRQRWEQQH